MGIRTYLKTRKDRVATHYSRLQAKVLSKFGGLPPKTQVSPHSCKKTGGDSLELANKDKSLHLPWDKNCSAIDDEPKITESRDLEEIFLEEQTGPELIVPANSRLVKIVVRNGEIVEKLYITTEGENFLVNTKEIFN